MTQLPVTQPTRGTAIVESIPDFLRDKTEVKGVDELTQFIRPPFIKIVQGASDKTLKEEFPEKSVILVPGNDLVCEPGQLLIFTPIIFWQEFLEVNPIELKGQLPMVAARTFDKNSDIARRAKDPDLRNEQLLNPDGSPMLVKGKPVYRSYQDTRMFLIMIHGPVNPGRVCALTFSRAEIRASDRLATLISARQKSLFYCVFEAMVNVHRDKAGQYDWYGFDIDNPSGVSPWIQSQEQALEYEKMHDLLQKALAERQLVVSEHDDTLATEEEAQEPDGVVGDSDAF